METINISILRRLVDSFDVHSYTLWIVWILRVVAVEKAHSLAHPQILLPLTYKALYLIEIHKADIINMTIALSIEISCLGHTFTADRTRVGRMVAFALFLHFEVEVNGRRKVVGL